MPVSAVVQLVMAALQVAPQLASLMSTQIAEIKGNLSPEDQATIDASLDAAHAALQAAQPAPG